MKKGLLTVLLASLVLVGCQNYDDQFDDLNAQISALKSQVDGLSSLSGQVSSLSGTISGLSSGVAAAQAAATAAGTSAQAATAAANAIDLTGLAASLATLQTEVDAVQASLATAATASAVTTLQAELDAIETSLADLLATSNIYSTDVTVTNATTLNSALALGNKLNVLNATLTITGYSGMDYTKVQTLADRVNTMTGNLVYSAASSTGTEITFNNLVSAGNITMTQPKGYSFPKLANAAAIRLNSTYETTVTNISFPVLVSATSIDTDAAVAAAFDINFTYATNVDFGAMVTAPGNTITITTKKDATLDMDAYKSTDATGNAVDIDLTLNGPASFTNGTAAGTFASTGLPGNTVGAADGTISLTNVATAAIHNFRGGITLSTGVKNFTGNNIVTVTHSAATDLETMNVTMMRDNDPGLSAAAITAFEAETNTAQSISVGSAHTKLTSLTVTGTGGDVTADAAPALTTVNLTGLTAMDVVIDNNVALTSFTDATAANDWSFDNNDLMSTVNSSHTMKSYATTDLAASLSVVGNAEITSLTIGTNTIDDLDITGNAKLATLAATALTTNGTSTAGTVDIYDNAFVASLVKDAMESDAAVALTTYAKGKAADGGSITSTSGLNGLDTYLADAAATVNNIQQVWFDTVTKLEVQSTYGGAYADMTSSLPTSAPTRDGANATDFTSTYSGYMNYFFQKDAVTATTRTIGAVDAQVVSYAFDMVRNATTLAETTTMGTDEGFDVYAADVLVESFMQGEAYSGSANGTTVATVTDLINFINADTALDTGYGIDVSAAKDSFEKGLYTISYTYSTGANATAGAVSNNGLLNFTFGTYRSGAAMDLQAHVTDGNGAAGIATGVVAAINAAGEHTAALTGGNANQFYVTAKVSGAATLDRSPLHPAPPTLTFVTNSDSTTASLVKEGLGSTSLGSNVAYNYDSATASEANGAGSGSEFVLSTSKSTLNGLRVTLKNTGTVAFAGTTTSTSAVGIAVRNTGSGTSLILAPATTNAVSDLGGGLIVADVNIDPYVANTGTITYNEAPRTYVATFAQISSGSSATVTSAVTGYTNDKTGW